MSSTASRLPASLGWAFGLLWLGETVNGLGTALTQFALGVWVYENTGSLQEFASILLLGSLPSLIVLPWAGTLADRSDRRWVILATDFIATAMILGLAATLLVGRIELTYLYVFSVVSGALVSLRQPSYQAAVSVLVPQSTLTRASALSGLSQAGAGMVAPLVGGVLMVRVGFTGIVLIVAPFMVAGMVAVFAAFSQTPASLARAPSARPRPVSLVGGVFGGFTPALALLKHEPLLMRLLLHSVVRDALMILAASLLTPLVLSSGSSITLGMVNACGAAGVMLGAAALALTNTRQRVMFWVLVSNLGLSTGVLLCGFQSSRWGFCVCAFSCLFAGSTSGHCMMSLWARKVPEATRGSVFSLLMASRVLVSSFVLAASGVIGERVFEPALAADGRWARSLGVWLGTGKGHGVALLFVVAGGLGLLVTIMALARSNLRHLDELVHDVPRVPRGVVET